jgi:hypothetical protein
MTDPSMSGARPAKAVAEKSRARPAPRADRVAAINTIAATSHVHMRTSNAES